MKKILLICILAYVFTSCGPGSESSTNTDSTATSITPPPTADSTSTMAPMMGDTSKTDADSTN
ncbi:hypothetical protein QNI16_35960 [Cytophagaceae bacterium YF14B1]|uniref:Cytochrome C551 n=1 Tax=Xanthocytophaga flava TaxID=3048013 RepID=A0AAE3R0M3_9BACT|nr:hypothetical protein [Xanthocytophaga flavus]MDJ1485933.1 hypothetical protein [Xanthocytophaga flavus]